MHLSSHLSFTVMFEISDARKAIRAPQIRYAAGSPLGLIPTHSISLPGIRPISKRRRFIQRSAATASTSALSPGRILFICINSLFIKIHRPLFKLSALLSVDKKVNIRVFFVTFVFTIYRPTTAYSAPYRHVTHGITDNLKKFNAQTDVWACKFFYIVI